jgi:hypothetical protein
MTEDAELNMQEEFERLHGGGGAGVFAKRAVRPQVALLHLARKKRFRDRDG